MKKLCLFLSFMLLICLTFGCASNDNKQVETTSTEEVSSEPQTKSIGIQEPGSKKFSLTNITGFGIKEISIKSENENEFPANMLVSDDIFENCEERYLYYKPQNDTVESSSSDDKILTLKYDMKFVLENNTEFVLHSFPIDSLSEGKIITEDDIAYLDYTTISGEKISTKSSEIAEKELEKEKNNASSKEEVSQTTSKAAESTKSSSRTSNDTASSKQSVKKSDDGSATSKQTTSQAKPEPKVSSAAPKTDNNNDQGCLNGGLLY